MNNSKANILMFAAVVATVAVRAAVTETEGNPGSVATERAFPQLVHRNPTSPNGIKLAPLNRTQVRDPKEEAQKNETDTKPGKRSSKLRQAMDAVQGDDVETVSEGSANENVPNTGQNVTVSRIRKDLEEAVRVDQEENGSVPGKIPTNEQLRRQREEMLNRVEGKKAS